MAQNSRKSIGLDPPNGSKFKEIHGLGPIKCLKMHPPNDSKFKENNELGSLDPPNAL